MQQPASALLSRQERADGPPPDPWCPVSLPPPAPSPCPSPTPGYADASAQCSCHAPFQNTCIVIAFISRHYYLHMICLRIALIVWVDMIDIIYILFCCYALIMVLKPLLFTNAIWFCLFLAARSGMLLQQVCFQQSLSFCSEAVSALDIDNIDWWLICWDFIIYYYLWYYTAISQPPAAPWKPAPKACSLDGCIYWPGVLSHMFDRRIHFWAGHNTFKEARYYRLLNGSSFSVLLYSLPHTFDVIPMQFVGGAQAGSEVGSWAPLPPCSDEGLSEKRCSVWTGKCSGALWVHPQPALGAWRKEVAQVPWCSWTAYVW